jgi:3-phenylpropionate/trans-cinnamate dioxygenase ferredoxin reductase subunit
MHVVIVGNGVAGVSCALALRGRDVEVAITLISKESPYFFARTGLMYAFMDTLRRKVLEPFERRIYDEKRISRVYGEVVGWDVAARTLSIVSANADGQGQGSPGGQELTYDRLVLATGALPNQAPWRGLESEAAAADGKSCAASGLVHFVSLQDLDVCEALVATTREAVVVGGGLIGIELAECLKFHGIKTHFLIREASFWPAALSPAESEMVVAEMREHGIDVHLNTALQKVTRDSSGRIESISTESDRTFSSQMLGICVGVRPNTQLASKVAPLLAVSRGILVDGSFRTSVPNVYACGDCSEILVDTAASFENPVATLQEAIWYSAKLQGECCAGSILGDSVTYHPPLFFNSTKFFGMEFTTVGSVQIEAARHPEVFITHPKRRASLRIVYEASNKVVLAFNILGARVDHEVLARWITEGRSLEYCQRHWSDAQFDVEFGRVNFSLEQLGREQESAL